MNVRVDMTELNQLVGRIDTAHRWMLPKVGQAVEVSSRRIKDDARESATRANPSHAPAYPSAIDYDIKFGLQGVSSEIGPSLGKTQGSFGFLEDAPGGVAASPQGNLRKALENNIKDFETGLLKATEGIL